MPSIYVFSYFPFGFEGRIWDLIVSVPDHCLSFYFGVLRSFKANSCRIFGRPWSSRNKCTHAYGCGNSTLRFVTVWDEIFIDVHKLLRIVLKALHINKRMPFGGYD